MQKKPNKSSISPFVKSIQDRTSITFNQIPKNAGKVTLDSHENDNLILQTDYMEKTLIRNGVQTNTFLHHSTSTKKQNRYQGYLSSKNKKTD